LDLTLPKPIKLLPHHRGTAAISSRATGERKTVYKQIKAVSNGPY